MSFLQKPKNSTYLKGQAMITAVIFFVFVSLIILFGVANPSIKQMKLVSNFLNSRQSYFLAEAGMEDTLFRMRTGLPSYSGQTLFLKGQEAVSEITDTGGGKVILTTSNWNGLVRKIETRLAVGVGTAFFYGVQTGNGGLIMKNNSGVTGNVYANGDIAGALGAFIGGSAFAASSVSLFADQVNNTPNPAMDFINFRNSSQSQDIAQQFKVSTLSSLNKISFNLKKTGSPANATVRIVYDNNGSPGTNVLTTGTLVASQVTTNFSDVEVFFSSNPELVPDSIYWVVIDNSRDSSRDYYTVLASDNYTEGVAKIGQYGVSWNSTSPSSVFFAVYLGGVTAKIENVLVGSGGSGDAHAHTVNNIEVFGNLYCQIGSGNNKSCDSSLPDPIPKAFPISEGNIEQWKLEAQSGGIIYGNYDVTGEVLVLGPKRITGNLTSFNGTEIILNGTLWVEGNIIFSNNSIVSLSSGYGTDSGVILSDGWIDVSNNSIFNGSGQEGSYVMLISTSDCPVSSTCSGNNAIQISNNAESVIINAQKGTVEFGNNAGAKEVTAYKISLNNNAIITYESGLSDVNFSSGPSGGWDITSWKEVE